VRELTAPSALIADVGCGRGAMFDDDSLADRVVVCADSHRWDTWQPRAGIHYVVATADALPFREGAFELVGSFDVLEHLPDDHAGLQEQRRVVRPGGHVVTAVPADPRLWSAHDEAVGHYRRYTEASFRDLAGAVGLQVDRATHFFSFLWLPARLTRRRPLRTQPPGSGDGIGARAITRVIGALGAVERWWMSRRRLPWGTSLWFESRRGVYTR
jgi:SAM-dependent methyltransferase